MLDSAHQLRCFQEGECHFVPVAIFLKSLLDFAYQKCCYHFSALLLLESSEGLCHLSSPIFWGLLDQKAYFSRYLGSKFNSTTSWYDRQLCKVRGRREKQEMLTPFCETLPQTTIPAPESRILLEDTAEKDSDSTIIGGDRGRTKEFPEEWERDRG